METSDTRLARSPEPWTAYNALRHLSGLPEDDPEVRCARGLMLSHPNVRVLIDSLADWPGKVISSHKSAWQPYHKLAFAADIGFRWNDEGIGPIVEKVMSGFCEEGLPQLPVPLGAHSPIGATDTVAWAACDAPTTLYALSSMGLSDNVLVKKGVGFLVSLARANGWGCAVSPKLGNFRGPGKKSDPCPYANLIMLKLVSEHTGLMHGPEARAGIECLLNLWEHSMEEHPYIFWMGTDFRKLKAPFIWYDILHMAEVLSRFPAAAVDPRFLAMVDVINRKADALGMFAAESAWLPWKAWDFGQTKLPSSWISLRVRLINNRIAAVAPGLSPTAPNHG